MACSSDLEERLNAAMRAADLLQQAAAAHAQELRELGRLSGKAPSMCDEPSTADLGILEVKRPAFHSGSDSTEVAPPSQQPALLQIWRGPENDEAPRDGHCDLAVVGRGSGCRSLHRLRVGRRGEGPRRAVWLVGALLGPEHGLPVPPRLPLDTGTVHARGVEHPSD
mmetsp:Transcript_53343/g.149795  ORF Transcript_53343/g.149795 Transcript_53343/m.149795 type:complete len:167 (+) Transcript_53343:1-501(+)